MERKLNLVIKLVPFKSKQSSQIGIPKVLAISFMAFLVPASMLTGLCIMLACKST